MKLFHRTQNTLLSSQKKKKRVIFSLALFLTLIALLSFIFIDKVKLGNYFFGDSTIYAPEVASFLYKSAIIFDTQHGVPPVYANYQLGRIHFIRGEYDTALQYFKREKVSHPNNSKVYYMMGLTYGYDARYHTAIDYFKEYNRRVPDSWAGKNDEAWLHFKVGDLASARAVVEPEYQAGKYSPWTLLTYGTILLNQNECEAASLVLSLAYDASLTLTNESWGRAYPGNNPKDYGKGLHEMRETIKGNLALAQDCHKKTVEKK